MWGKLGIAFYHLTYLWENKFSYYCFIDFPLCFVCLLCLFFANSLSIRGRVPFGDSFVSGLKGLVVLCAVVLVQNWRESKNFKKNSWSPTPLSLITLTKTFFNRNLHKKPLRHKFQQFLLFAKVLQTPRSTNTLVLFSNRFSLSPFHLY